MAGQFAVTSLKTPRGFGLVLEGLTREVLRDQPSDIPSYAANYFEELLKEREVTGVDPIQQALDLEKVLEQPHYQVVGEADIDDSAAGMEELERLRETSS